MTKRGGDGVFWNDETQSWDSGAPHAPFIPPLPSRPEFQPLPGGPHPHPHPPPHPQDEPQYGPQDEPQYDPPPVAPGPGPRPWFRRNAVIAAVVGAVLLMGLGSWFLWGRGGDGQPDARPGPITGSSATPSTPSSQQPGMSSPSPTTSPSGPPAGYQAAREPEFTIFVPEGWERRVEEGKSGIPVYYYEDPGNDQRVMQVFQVTEPGITPRAALKLAESDLEKYRSDYHRNSLGAVTHGSGAAAELDYSFKDRDDGTKLRVLDRVFHADDQTLYAVLTMGPADAWPEQQEIQREAVGSFCLPNAC